MLELSEAEIRSLTSWLDIIQNPFETRCLAEWRIRVKKKGISVLGAEQALSILPLPGHPPLVVRANGTTGRVSALVNLQSRGPTLFSRDQAQVRLTASESRASIEFACAAPTESSARSFRARAQPLVNLAGPTFSSAVRAIVLLGPHASALGRIIDRLLEPVMLVDACGTVVHVNNAARSILDRDPSGAALHEEMRLAAVGMLARDNAAGIPASHVKWFGEYTIEPVYGDPSLANGSALVIVRLGTTTGPLVAPQLLQARFGLTPRQAEVAALLVRGATAKKIAAQLGIRYRTARNHVQSTISALGVSSKAEVPARILNATESTASGRSEGTAGQQ